MALRLALGAAVALLGATVPATAAPAAPGGGPCPTTSDGVTLVVDFHGLGGRGVEVSCAAGSPSSGFNALKSVGYQLTPVTKNTNFLCRIDGQPAAASCASYQPTSAYWSYWLAPRGGDWTYSGEGGDRKPPVGSVDGWSFAQVGAEDDAPPPRGEVPARPVPTTAKPTTTTATSKPVATTTTRPAGGPGPLTGATTTTRARPSDGRATTTTGPGSTSSTSSGDSTTSSEATTSSTSGSDESASGTLVARDAGDGGGGAGGVVVGGGVVVALGGLIALTTWRRRTHAGPPLDPLP